MEVRIVTDGPDLKEIKTLFVEYAEWVAVDLSFQGFAEELAGLPGDYVAPDGTLLLGVDGSLAAGCIAVHKWQARTCEMKRLYVRPRFQGRGCGRLLAERAISWAAEAGYERMLLDTSHDGLRSGSLRAAGVSRHRALPTESGSGDALHDSGAAGEGQRPVTGRTLGLPPQVAGKG